jgi:hypothetical protein
MNMTQIIKNIVYRLPIINTYIRKISSFNYICQQLSTNHTLLQKQYNVLESKYAFLQERVNSYYTSRWNSVDYLADYLVNAELAGDYAEFGVFKGTTFAYAANLFKGLFPLMRFLAFDSFEGLPEPQGIDKSLDNWSSGFHKGQFVASEEDFTSHVLEKSGLETERLVKIKGWFNDTLTAETRQKHKIEKLAVAWIDCDLYASTVPVLEFITPLLSVGSVIVFDDWRSYRNLPDKGEQRACREWLDASPSLTLNTLLPGIGFHGIAFTVGALP